MRISVIVKAVFVFELLWSAMSGLRAQDIVATLEAEAGTLTPPAKIKYVNGYSGNAYVGDNDPGSAILFNNVQIENEGTYEIKTYYTSMQLRSIAVKSNNFPEAISTITAGTADWNMPPTATMSTYIYLNKGVNTIKISPYPVGQGGPNIDKFEIVTTDVTIPQPGEFPILLEAETARLFGDLKVKPTDGTSKAGLSGGKYIGDFNLRSKSYLQFADVEVPQEGTYELKVFSMGSGRKLAIKINQYEKVVITTKNSPSWDDAPASEVSTLIYMDKGRNRITMSVQTDDGPNLDKFEIHQTTQTIPKPAIQPVAFVSSFTNHAELTAQHSNEGLSNIADNNELTVYQLAGVTSTQITAKCEYPILLSGFLLSSGIDEKADVTQWTLESSTNGTSWKSISANSSTDLSGAYLFTVNRTVATAAADCAQYYRLTAKGNNDINVAEWQLFGAPYIANANGETFPQDITEGVNLEQNASAYPVGAFGDNWSEKFLNLFDRKLTTKYFAAQSRQFYVEIKPDKEYILHSYTLTSVDNYPDRDPAKWTLSGYNEQSGWVELDRRVEFAFPTRLSTMRFDIANTGAFSKFILDVENNNGSSDIQLLKFQLFGEEFIAETGLKYSLNKDIFISSDQGKIAIHRTDNKLLNFSVYNTSGILLKKGKLTGNQNEVSLCKGVYIVHLADKTTRYSQKVIVL